MNSDEGRLCAAAERGDRDPRQGRGVQDIQVAAGEVGDIEPVVGRVDGNAPG